MLTRFDCPTHALLIFWAYYKHFRPSLFTPLFSWGILCPSHSFLSFLLAQHWPYRPRPEFQRPAINPVVGAVRWRAWGALGAGGHPRGSAPWCCDHVLGHDLWSAHRRAFDRPDRRLRIATPRSEPDTAAGGGTGRGWRGPVTPVSAPFH